ncbi:MAG: hypothetical protein Q9163_005938 [Psora crenata]
MSSRADNAQGTLSSSRSLKPTGKPNRNGATDISLPPAQENSASSQEQASSSFQEFLDEDHNAFNEFVRRSEEARQKIRRYSKAYASIEKYMDYASNLQLTVAGKDTQLREKDAEISRLNSNRQTMLQDFEDRYSKWSQQRDEQENRIKELELSLAEAKAHAAEADGARASLKEKEAQLESKERKVTKMEQKLRKADDKSRDLKRQLDQSTDRLREWDEYISLVEEIDFASFGSRLSTLFSRFLNMAKDYFLVDLSEELLNDHSAWDKAIDSLRLPIALPPRNSQVAKETRMITAMHVVATHLHRDILKPYFIPNSVAANDKEVLGRLFREDPRKEAVTRALLLSAYTGRDVDGEIKQVVEAI